MSRTPMAHWCRKAYLDRGMPDPDAPTVASGFARHKGDDAVDALSNFGHSDPRGLFGVSSYSVQSHRQLAGQTLFYDALGRLL